MGHRTYVCVLSDRGSVAKFARQYGRWPHISRAAGRNSEFVAGLPVLA